MGKQKVVLRVLMEDAKKRSRALTTVVGLPGVLSAAIEGEDTDHIVVIGEGIDSISLTTMLRKRMGYVQLVSVAPFEENKEGNKENKMDDKAKNVQPVIWPCPLSIQPPYQYEIDEVNYDHSCCTM